MFSSQRLIHEHRSCHLVVVSHLPVLRFIQMTGLLKLGLWFSVFSKEYMLLIFMSLEKNGNLSFRLFGNDVV